MKVKHLFISPVIHCSFYVNMHIGPRPADTVIRSADMGGGLWGYGVPTARRSKPGTSPGALVVHVIAIAIAIIADAFPVSENHILVLLLVAVALRFFRR